MTGNPLFDKILMGLNVVGVLGALGVFIYTEFLIEPPAPQNNVQFAKMIRETREETRIEPFKLEKLTVNLFSRKTRLRFLDLQVNIEPFRHEHQEILKKNKAILSDIIIKVVGEMTAEEVNTVAGKILLESRIKKRFNETMSKTIIKKIFFSTMVVS